MRSALLSAQTHVLGYRSLRAWGLGLLPVPCWHDSAFEPAGLKARCGSRANPPILSTIEAHCGAGSRRLLWHAGWRRLPWKIPALTIHIHTLCFLSCVIPASVFLAFISFLLFHLFHSLTSPLSLLNSKFSAFVFLIFFQRSLPLCLLFLQRLESLLHVLGRCNWLRPSCTLTGLAVSASSFDMNCLHKYV